MTQVQTIGGLKRGRGRGRGSGRGRDGRGRGRGRSDKPASFEPFQGSANSLSAQQATGIPQQHPVNQGSGVFAPEHHHLAGIAKLQQQHDEAIALRAVQLAELQRQQQSQLQQQQQHHQQGSASDMMEAPKTSAQAASQPQAVSPAVADSVIDLCDDEADQPAQQVSKAPRPPAKPQEQVSWSRGVGRATSSNSAPSGSNNVGNPFWCPARYIPAGGENQLDLHLQTHEVVQILDSGLVAHQGMAILDTGAIAMTLCMLLSN